VYPHGVDRPGVCDHASSDNPVTNFRTGVSLIGVMIEDHRLELTSGGGRGPLAARRL
jgi:hypothetical protein